jgi:MIP family channel proteins
MNITRRCIAEAIGTFALIFIGVGAITVPLPALPGGRPDLVAIALAHGLAIAVMVTATAHISGGQLNPAVTFGLLLGGKMSLRDSLCYWAAQLAGAAAAGFLCLALFGHAAVATGTPQLAAGAVSAWQGVVIEAVLTFFLVFVVYGAAVDARGPHAVAGLAIGLTVTLDILCGGPYTGAAMNPARTFGPALAANVWPAHWVYWAGPMLGGALAGLVYGRVFLPARREESGTESGPRAADQFAKRAA